jgi:hypothetical protein
MSYGDADTEPVEEDVHGDAGTEPGSSSGAGAALVPVKPGENVNCAVGTRPEMRDATADVRLESGAVDLIFTVVAAPGPGEGGCIASAEPGKWGVASEAYT